MAVRYFPVSQDINADEEVWELTEKFGDRALRVWLECLSIADRNNGVLPGRWDRYPNLLAGRCKSTTRHLEGVCKWLTRWLVMDSEGVARVRNYHKYHKIRAERSIAPNHPNHPNHPKIKKPASPEPSAGAKKPNGLDPEIKQIADQVYATDKAKFARLVVWIRQAEQQNFPAAVIAEALRRFLPHAASVEQWYPYLDKIIYKTKADMNASAAVADHEAHKAAERKFAVGALRGIVKDA